jgi:hypothetical protein
MFKRMVLMGILIGAATAANADELVTGTVTQINIQNGVVGVLITAAGSGSPCPTGWFHAYDTDTSTTVVNRLLTELIFAQSRGASLTLYSISGATCGTTHFAALTSQ